MATSVVSIKPPDAWEPPPSTPLDEAAWDAWVSKGLTQERRTEARFVKAIKFAAMAALMAGSALWSRVTVPSEAMVKFIVVAGSIVVLSRPSVPDNTRSRLCSRLWLSSTTRSRPCLSFLVGGNTLS